jgi:tetratricopeptide (TPR) repeat protein
MRCQIWGDSYDAAGRRDELVKVREQVLALRSKVLGPEHPYTLAAMTLLGNAYDKAGHHAEAFKLREQVLVLERKVSGAEHPDTLEAMSGLANSYEQAGRRDEALKLREQVLVLERKVNGPEHPDTLDATGLLAIAYDQAGRHDDALKLREEVLALRRKVSGPKHPDTLMAMNELANSYYSAGSNMEAIALLEQACESDPKDTVASLTLATWQTWFGQDVAYEATRRRLIQQAEGTDQATTADRAGKAFCLRPSTDAALLSKARNLARRAVELGKSDSSLPWFQLGLGLAEYRNGQYAAADQALTIAEQTVGDNHVRPVGIQREIQGTARLIRAMSLFRQDKLEEARKLFSQAEAQMPPLPEDESKPLVDRELASHDDLIWWLAYKEAKGLLAGPAAPVAEPPAAK